MGVADRDAAEEVRRDDAVLRATGARYRDRGQRQARKPQSTRPWFLLMVFVTVACYAADVRRSPGGEKASATVLKTVVLVSAYEFDSRPGDPFR